VLLKEERIESQMEVRLIWSMLSFLPPNAILWRFGSRQLHRTFLQYAGQQDKCGRESLVAGTTLVVNL